MFFIGILYTSLSNFNMFNIDLVIQYKVLFNDEENGGFVWNLNMYP